MTQFGELSTTTPRNDASPARGQWQLDDAYRYISEAYGGYHFGDMHRGVNVEAGIFMSYIGLWSYYNFDNWTYQPSYVSSNTPWFFNGARVQWFPSDQLKIEPWLINGWQSYAQFNKAPGIGGQVRYAPTGDLILIFNQYVIGADVLGGARPPSLSHRRLVQVKWYEDRASFVSKARVDAHVRLRLRLRRRRQLQHRCDAADACSSASWRTPARGSITIGSR